MDACSIISIPQVNEENIIRHSDNDFDISNSCIKLIETNRSSTESKVFTESEKVIHYISSYDIESEEHVIPSTTHCLICFDEVKISSVPVNIFNGKIFSDFSKKYFHEILSEILQETLTNKEVSSDFICKYCFNLLKDWDNLNMKLKMITMVVQNTYQETCESFKARKHSSEEGSNEVFKIKVKRRKHRGPNKFSKSNTTSLDTSYKLQPLKKMEENAQAKCSSNVLDSISKENSSPFDLFLKKGLEVNEGLTFQGSASGQNLHCDSCSFQSYSSEEVEKHRQQHFCQICGLFIKHPRQMKNHLMKVHNYSHLSKSQDKPYECFQCHKKYSSNSSLHNHKRTIHSAQDFVCEVCGKTFKHKRLLSLHLVRHTKKKAKCSQCDACFYQVYELNKHINSVHRKVRGYECPICFKYLCQRSSLTHHMSQHTNAKKMKLCENEPFELDKVISNHNENKINDKTSNPICVISSDAKLSMTDESPNVSFSFNLATNQDLEKEKELEQIEINLEANSFPTIQNDSLGISVENSTGNFEKSLNCREEPLASSLVEDNENKTKDLENYLISEVSLYDDTFDVSFLL